MLTKQAIETALPLTIQFEAAGLMLTPVPNSPLSGLYEATYRGGLDTLNTASIVAESQSERDILESVATDIEFLTNARVEVLDDTEHNGVMDTWVKIALDATRGALTVARTQVAPSVTNLAERVGAKLTELTPAEVAGKEILIKPVNSVIDHDGLKTLTSKFIDGVPLEDPELGLRSGDATPEEIRAMLLTGLPSLDTAIQTWSAGLTDEFLNSLWDTIFTSGRNRVYPLAGRGLRSIITDDTYAQDASLAIFLLGNHIVNEGPNEGTVGGIDSVTDYAARFRNQAAAQLQRLLEHVEKIAERGYLVVSKIGGNITVNETVYNDFLSQGGTNEAILGVLVSGDGVSSAEEILEAKDKYERLWLTELAYRTETNTTTMFNLKKKLLVEEYRQQALEDAQSGGEDLLIANERISNLAGDFSLYLDTLVLRDLDDLYEVCLKGLCLTRYKATDSYEFLSDIGRIMNENPRLEAADAATVATLKYIMRWLISQVVVTSN